MKLTKKRLFSMLMSVTMVMGLLAGCSTKQVNQTEDTKSAETSQGTEATSDTGADSGEKITLRFAWWGGDSRHKATLEAIAKYMELNPNVVVEGEYMGYDGYYEKLVTSLSSGTAPDIFQFHRDWISDVQGSEHYLADMSTLPIDLTTLDSGVLERSGKYNDESVLFSTTLAGQVLYYNTEFFAKNEINPEEIKTWDDLKAVGEKVHSANADQYLMAADIDVLNRLVLLEYLSQLTGGSIVNEDYTLNFTEEQLTASLQNILDLYTTGTFEPFGESAAFVGVMEQNTKWINGQLGMLLDVSNTSAKYKASIESETGVMAIPRLEDAKTSGVDFSGNLGFCINDNSKYKEEAAKFLDWFANSEEASVIVLDSRGLPASSTAMKALQDNDLVDETAQQALEISAPDSYTINTISGNTELETIRKDILQEVIYGDLTPEDGAKEIITQYEKVLSDLRDSK